MILVSLLTLTLAAAAPPQDPVPATVAFRQACLDATADAVVMNVAAHPDDESARTMVYLRNKHGVRTVTVYSTCGEGGQNAISREIGRALAAIRVGETRAAAARYGTRIRWLGFPDFGYSKSLDETLAVWGREQTLHRMRAALDDVAPDIVITNHSIDGGHGHHRASFLAIREACRSHAEETGELVPLYQRARRPDPDAEPSEALFEIDSSELDPVRGATFARQAHEAWTLHRSQGPWGPHDPTRVRADVWRQAFPEEGLQAEGPFEHLKSMFDVEEVRDVLGDASAVARLQAELAAFATDRTVGEHVAAARRLLPTLRELRGRLDGAEARARVARRIDALERVVVHGSGLVLETWIADAELPIGGTVELRAALRGGAVEDLRIHCGDAVAEPLEEDGGWLTARLAVPPDAFDDGIVALTRTWLFEVRAELTLDGLPLEVRREVAVRLAPERDVSWDRAYAYVPAASAWTRVFSLEVEHHGHGPLEGALSFRAPEGVTIESVPPRIRLEPGQRAAQTLVRVAWKPRGDGAREDAIEVQASLGDARSRLLLQPVELPADEDAPRVALVRGPDDTVERTLRDLGIEVETLDETALATAELGAFDTLVLDIRAYHHRPDLANHRDRLLAFCRAGGRVVAFYHKEREWNESPGKPLLAPFALKVGRGRVSEEDAPVELLKPDHVLWNHPFRIEPGDFEAWVQERGLNFPSEWDPAWVPLLSTHDRDEDPLEGGLLYTRYGRGDYVYCSLALYRQLRIGHPGAVRILLNLLWR